MEQSRSRVRQQRDYRIAGLVYVRKYHTPRIEGQYRASLRAPGTGGTSYGYGHTAQEALDNLAKVPDIIDKMLEDIINSDKPPEERWGHNLCKLTYEYPEKPTWLQKLTQWAKSLLGMRGD